MSKKTLKMKHVIKKGEISMQCMMRGHSGISEYEWMFIREIISHSASYISGHYTQEDGYILT